MSLRWYLIIMSAATLICWSIFFYVIWTVDPNVTNWAGFFLFYVSLFLSLVGTAAIVGSVIRFVGFKKHLETHAVKEAFRQSFLFAAFIELILYLLAKDLFNWVSLAALIIALSVLEFLLISYQKNENEIVERDIATEFGQEKFNNNKN